MKQSVPSVAEIAFEGLRESANSTKQKVNVKRGFFNRKRSEWNSSTKLSGERQAAILRAEAKAKAIEVAERLLGENGRQAADYDLAAQYRGFSETLLKKRIL